MVLMGTGRGVLVLFFISLATVDAFSSIASCQPRNCENPGTKPCQLLLSRTNNEDVALPTRQGTPLEFRLVARIRNSVSLEDLIQNLKESTTPSATNLHVERSAELPEPMTHIMESVSPNIAAVSLRRLIGFKSSSSSHGELNSWKLALIKRLAELAEGEMSSFSIHALVDSFNCLAVLQNKVDNPLDHTQMRKLAINLVTEMDQRRAELIRGTHPARLVNILQSLQVISLEKSTDSSKNAPACNLSVALRRIREAIYQKCVQTHNLPQLSPGDMSIALKTLALQPDMESKFAIALMRRFRKQPVRRAATVRQLFRALRAAAAIGIHAKDNAEKLHAEAKVMVYTVFREILSRQQQPPQFATSDNRGSSLTMDEAMIMISTVSNMGVLNKKTPNHIHSDEEEKIDMALQFDWSDYLAAQGGSLLQGAGVKELSQFLRAVEATQCPDLKPSSDFVRELGQHAVTILEQRGLEPQVKPKTANGILRCAANWWGRNNTVMEPFGECARILFTDETFLELCHAEDLTNFLVFLDKTKHLGNNSPDAGGHTQSEVGDPLLAIAARTMDDDVADQITPSQASRMLFAFTSVIVARGRQRKLIRRQAARTTNTESLVLGDLFHFLGGHLLTDDLSTRDISSALCAYAKASYIQDMGIFDHLAGLMAARLDECSTRQMAQSLWACGKMTVWEQQQQQQRQLEGAEQGDPEDSCLDHSPPYLPSANQIATFLTEHNKQMKMNAQDVAQSMWAMGRLQTVQKDISDEYSEIMEKLVSRATILAPRLTMQETSNVLWGMSMTGFRCCDPLVQSFTDRILHVHEFALEKPSPKEAASIMIALGRMDIQDEQVFEALSNDMLDQIECASAQAIANALWAHRAVHIPPPEQLLDRWAIEKLGLVAVRPRQQS
ncbi:expressed unknown protein [Seminavis robusta]|uniref:Uncharacterized protein n=1 Tax=Seminavis robusta TaxID=568900 RepID=A0A9N8HGC9_9STRA|nr:expressed unknown protein [Seminavis robusta]|eukprot:Sro625_g177610.1 n/a (898) ;mRNA; f:34360-37053